MRKILVSTLIIFNTVLIAQTDVSGTINSNTTWTTSGSPYRITDDVAVAPSVVLTLEPGVRVEASTSKTLQINGILNAVGSKENEIVFTSADSSWIGIKIMKTGDATLDYCIIEDARWGVVIEQDIEVDISNSVFRNNEYGIWGLWRSNVALTNCLFLDNVNGYYSESGYTTKFDKCTFADNSEYGYYASSQTTADDITNSTFWGNKVGIYLRDFGFVSYPGVINCTIANNNTGVIIADSNYEGYIKSSNLLDNIDFALELFDRDEFVAEGNYWGTAEKSKIDEVIFDFYDNTDYGVVSYSNYLSEPNTDAPPIPPNGLSIQTKSSNKITLSWEASPITDLAGYKVYYDTDASGYPYSTSLDVGNKTSATLTGLGGVGTNYYFAVTAYDFDGNESWYSFEAVQRPPEPFELVFPYDSDTLEITRANYLDTLFFAWNETVDPDEDNVTYDFEFTGDLGVLYWHFFDHCDETKIMCNVPYHRIEDFLSIEGMEKVSGTWTIVATDGVSRTLASNGPLKLTIDASQVGIEETDLIPETFALHANFPNPFNPSTTITYDLPKRSQVTLGIYDLLGKQIKTLVKQSQDAGNKIAVWDGTDDLGRQVSAGVYLYQIQAGQFTQTRKMLLLK